MVQVISIPTRSGGFIVTINQRHVSRLWSEKTAPWGSLSPSPTVWNITITPGGEEGSLELATSQGNCANSIPLSIEKKITYLGIKIERGQTILLWVSIDHAKNWSLDHFPLWLSARPLSRFHNAQVEDQLAFFFTAWDVYFTKSPFPSGSSPTSCWDFFKHAMLFSALKQSCDSPCYEAPSLLLS